MIFLIPRISCSSVIPVTGSTWPALCYTVVMSSRRASGPDGRSRCHQGQADCPVRRLVSDRFQDGNHLPDLARCAGQRTRGLFSGGHPVHQRDRRCRGVEPFRSQVRPDVWQACLCALVCWRGIDEAELTEAGEDLPLLERDYDEAVAETSMSNIEEDVTVRCNKRSYSHPICLGGHESSRDSRLSEVGWHISNPGPPLWDPESG
jgi:hypothetical protein